jgi:hypothetical protein
LPDAHIKKSDSLDSACAKSRISEALLAQAVAMQMISLLTLNGGTTSAGLYA